MHSLADDPLLFCEAHLFDLDCKRPTFYTVHKTVCLLLYTVSGPWTMVLLWNWNLDPGLSTSMPLAVYFCGTF